MSTRHFGRLFTPRSVAIIGATERAGSVGSVVTRNLASGGFAGPIYAVNPTRGSVHGVTAWPTVAALPETPDLAVIATPPDTVPELVAQLSDKGTRAVVILTAGFGEGADPVGRERLARTLAAATPHRLRIVGPNCLGMLVPDIGLNASFAHIGAHAGGLAFVTQSGAIATAVLDWAEPRGLGFSHIVSMGTMADIDFGDMLDWLTQDPSCRAVLLYIEAVTNARKFLSAARACARLKPVVVVKAGRYAEGARAARSHTGALAGSDSAYDAAFRRAGMLRVSAVDELFAAAETLAKARRISGDRLAVLTNGGGFGVLAVDALAASGGRLAALDPATLAALDRTLPPTWSHGNPVDIIGDANAARYRSATEALLADPATDALLVINCPTAVASSVDAARAVAAVAAVSDRPVLTSWIGEAVQRDARAVFAAARVPTYDTPEAAVGAFAQMVAYRRNQEALRQVPVAASVDADRECARAIVADARAAGRTWLSGPDARALLACYGVPVNPMAAAATPEEAAGAAAPFPSVALKIDSPDIVHKSDVGGVMLGVVPTAVADAVRHMLAAVRVACPEARIDGVTVEPMARLADAVELIVGATRDADFGPLILFGEGGIRVEVAADRALGLPPLNLALARDMMSRTRIDRLLGGYRGVAAADRDVVARVLIAVGAIAVDLPEVAELDINPLLASSAGVLALDARVRLQDPALAGPPAIRPYPRELERDLTLRDGGTLRLRPVRPEDDAALADLFAKVSPEDVRLSAFSALDGFSRELAARVTQIDYDREIALVAFAGFEAVAVAHLRMDADRERAEYGIIVRSDAQGRGIGMALLTELLDVARANGVGEVFGTVQGANRAMLGVAQEVGFAVSPLGEGLVCTSLRLRAPAPD